MFKKSKSIELAKYVLPSELVDYFELVGINESAEALHFYLDELNVIPLEYKSLDFSPNGFYAELRVKDFPLRDKKVILHVRRRWWVDSDGKSYSRHWEVTSSGTRYSREFADFLKEALG